jgi:hypothetical protein
MNSNITNTPKLAHPVAPVTQTTKAAASTAIPPEPTALADAAQAKWADKINQRLRKGQEAIIAAGNELIAAKKALGHGGFGAMFKSSLVRTDQRTAEMLMRIAAHPALSNPSNCSILPHSLRSLDKLATLEVAVIERGIKAGEITPTMTSADAGDFVRSKLDAHPKKAPKAAATARADAPEPGSPSDADDKTSAPAARFDAQVFKAALTQFLEREYAKAPRACAGEMQAAVAAACSVFFSASMAPTRGGVESVAPSFGGKKESASEDTAQPSHKAPDGVRDVEQSVASGHAPTTQPAELGLPAFRKKYTLPDAARPRLEQDLTALRTSEPTSGVYVAALRRVLHTGHYMAVAGNFDAFCAEFLRRDAAEVKRALESEQAEPETKQSEQLPPAPVQLEPKRPLTLKEKIALSKQALRVTA